MVGQLGDLAPLFHVVVLDTCASTNSVLLDSPPPDDGRVHVVAAEHQTAGRGRRGRSWHAWPGSSLTFSTLWRFPAGAPVPAGLSLVAGLAVARALEGLGVGHVALKWPNDVLVGGHKVAGILVELLPGRGRTPAAVIGVGLNLRLPPDSSIPDQPQVTDLAAHLDPLPQRGTVMAGLLREMHALFDTYAYAGFAALRGAWQQRNAFAGQPVRIVAESGETHGTCAGVDEDGALLLRTDAGITRILSGDVSLRLLE
ncbi:MAG TPA: biotin--[acetyl-CoA-carboxylase] ligase [Rhodocyclaceae bacterium]|nr:biotin--[acetyl-CoA-carboxylase] ligase [Rhodocyclaceae bacterium]